MGYHTIISFHNGFEIEDKEFPCRLTIIEDGSFYKFVDMSSVDGKQFALCKSRFICMTHEEPTSSGCIKE